MSPDDIFAANMWPWPDPLIKRDAMGRVVFVNAAFLQLYGGRVENWAHQPIQGWPTPNPQGLPHRFETRVGAGQTEIIYDWVEVTMSDGNALAIARDVTIFRKEPLVSEPVIEPQMAPPVASAYQAPPQGQPAAFAQAPATVHTPPPEAAPARAPEPAPVQQSPIAPEPASVFETPPVIAPEAPIAAPAAEIAPPVETPPLETPPLETAPQAATPINPAPIAEPPAAPDAPVTVQIEQPPMAAPEAAQPPERDFERRALPIEDGDAVLGSNWRDAVIAKAVGADLSPPAEEEPAAAAPSLEPAEIDEDAPIGAGLRILLAEDNAINALLTRTLLEAEGCTVETVEDGQLAVQAMTDNMYDLIFMDMRMPNMDGLEATRKIRAMGPRTADLPIIALTANAFDDDRNACFDSGMNDFMTKPVSAEELTAMVQTWTQKKTDKEAAA